MAQRETSTVHHPQHRACVQHSMHQHLVQRPRLLTSSLAASGAISLRTGIVKLWRRISGFTCFASWNRICLACRQVNEPVSPACIGLAARLPPILLAPKHQLLAVWNCHHARLPCRLVVSLGFRCSQLVLHCARGVRASCFCDHRGPCICNHQACERAWRKTSLRGGADIMHTNYLLAQTQLAVLRRRACLAASSPVV